MPKKPVFKLVNGPPFKLISFPCQAGIKRKLVYNLKDFSKIYNFTNKMGSKGMYNTVYSFDTILPTGKPYWNSARVDKIWVDIDLNDHDYDILKCWLGMLSMHLFLEHNDIMHCVLFTGNGYHVYVGVDSSGVPPERKNDYISTVTDDIERVTGAAFCICVTASPTARITRTIGSYCVKKTSKEDMENPKYHDYIDNFIIKNGFKDRYCVSLTDEEIHSGFMNIYRRALTRTYDVHMMGKYKIAMTSVRKIRKHVAYLVDEVKIAEVKAIDDSAIKDVYDLLAKFSIFEEDIPICMKTMLKNRNMSYAERYELTVYLSMMDLSVNEIGIVWHHVLSPAKFKHGMSTNNPRDIVGKTNVGLYATGCKRMKELGYCEEDRCSTKTMFPFMKE